MQDTHDDAPPWASAVNRIHRVDGRSDDRTPPTVPAAAPTRVDGAGMMPGGAAFDACPSCGSARQIVTEPVISGASGMALACSGCGMSTRI